MSNFNHLRLEVVCHDSETQSQVIENFNKLTGRIRVNIVVKRSSPIL